MTLSSGDMRNLTRKVAVMSLEGRERSLKTKKHQEKIKPSSTTPNRDKTIHRQDKCRRRTWLFGLQEVVLSSGIDEVQTKLGQKSKQQTKQLQTDYSSLPSTKWWPTLAFSTL